MQYTCAKFEKSSASGLFFVLSRVKMSHPDRNGEAQSTISTGSYVSDPAKIDNSGCHSVSFAERPTGLLLLAPWYGGFGHSKFVSQTAWPSETFFDLTPQRACTCRVCPTLAVRIICPESQPINNDHVYRDGSLHGLNLRFSFLCISLHSSSSLFILLSASSFIFI